MELEVMYACKVILLFCYVAICAVGWQGIRRHEREFTGIGHFVHVFTLSMTFIGIPVVFYYLFKLS